jgi:hypothetical protein
MNPIKKNVIWILKLGKCSILKHIANTAKIEQWADRFIEATNLDAQFTI